MKEDPKWACPKCGAGAGEHGRKPTALCSSHKECGGLICECDVEDEGPQVEDDDHGMYANPCKYANCYHCGWGGQFPAPAAVRKWKAAQKINPSTLTGWQKEAWEAGWRPQK